MVRHLVTFTLEGFDSPAAAQSHLQKIKVALEALPARIPALKAMRVYPNENPAEAVRTVLYQDQHDNMVLWQIPPQGSLPPHRHPSGEDIWLVLRGEADLIDDAAGSRRTIHAGESVVVGIEQTHGAINVGHEDCVLLSVIRPSAGFQPA